MPLLAGLVSKLGSLRTAIADAFSKLAEWFRHTHIPIKIRSIIDKWRQFLHAKIPGARERLILGCCAAILLVLIVVFIAINKSDINIRAVPVAGDLQRNIMPPEELFLPEEPDFIPGILLERERRSSWTVEDAAPYWQDPLKNGEEPWRQYIEKAVDELMERVP